MQNPSLEPSKEILEGYRLSPQQKHLWLLQQRDYCLYRVHCAVLITGSLNLEILKTALEKVVESHEILRTDFRCLPGLNIPLQVIRDGEILWNFTAESTSETLQAKKNKFQSLVQQFSQPPFDFEYRSTLNASLVTLSPKQQILLLGLPALCTDTIGIQNLVAEISRSYAATLKGEELVYEPLQYADIAEWQNELLEAEEYEIAREYWRKQDISALQTLKLPWEKQVADLKFQPQVVELAVEPDLKRAIATLVSQYKTSISTFLLACWNILFYRLTEQTDLIVGMAFAGRKWEELESVIGLLVRYLPIPCHLSETLQVYDLLQQIEQAKQDVDRWQEYFTWEAIIDSTKSDIESSIFPLSFDFVQLHEQDFTEDISCSIQQISTCVEPFKVKLSGIQTEDALNLEFHYDAKLFEAEDIERLAAQFQTLLTNIVANPNTAISQLEILSNRENYQLLVEFNQTQAEYPQDKCIHQLFEEQVARTPNNIAVVFANQHLTYAQLNARANQLAHYLRHLGVGAEVLVGIYVERSPQMLVGLLGILKAGGAYVPLDPSYPQERLGFMLEDTQAPVLLTQERLLTNLPNHSAKVVCLDRDWEAIAVNSPENPDSNVTPENLSYVIYTSGSTGKPKGTLIPHRGLVNYLSWCIQAYAVEQGEGAIVHSSLSFDATITGLFAPLLVGCQVRLLPEIGIEALSNALQSSANYSLVKITPAHLELLSQQIPPQSAAGCTKAFIIGGENLAAEQIAFWQDSAPETLLVNEYGPTETVVGCCVYRVPQGQHRSGSIPIGRAIANTQLYLLDQNLQPVPLGVPGELYIGGAGVARGYLNRPDLTAQKFIPDPFSNTPGARVYKSGDLARYLPNGDIEYLGRIDAQVKIRGFRIELGEIEALLSQHSDVQKAVVVAREDESGKRLVAYVVPESEQVANVNDLRDFLKAQLPEYMLPAAFVLLKTLPLTANGKVDRNALPIPEQVRPQLVAAFVAPRTGTEQAIAGIWAEVLKLERVGIHDNFFELGGHSLLLTQVTSRLHKALQIEVSLRQLFETPTIAQLAEVITQKLAQQTDDATLAQMLAELEELSEDEVQAVLAAESQ